MADLHIPRSVLVRYHEIALKGRNRPLFERKLLEAIRRVSHGLGVTRVRKKASGIILDVSEEALWEELRRRLQRVFGIAKMAWAYHTEANMEALKEAVKASLDGRTCSSFRVTASRADKSFPLTSLEIQRELGAYIKALTGWPVDLEHPELTIFVDVLPGEIYFYFETEKGPGGLPVGVQGKVVCLLSGGIDSPVAAYRLMKRGCSSVFVHFHAFPLLWGVSRYKVRELVQILNEYQFHSRLYLVPFANLQQRLILTTPPPYRVVIYRRLMARIAERIARREGAQALATGESLGQVSSQTLENLAAIEAAVSLPILRPLIGMDKQEIVDQAKLIGTYPLSIQPDEDCCTLFVPRHPATRTSLEEIERIEARLDIEGLVHMGLEGAEVKEFTWEP